MLCENSGYDLTSLRGFAAAGVRFLSFFGNDHPRHLGKGYGEMSIIKRALKDVQRGDLVVKVTGRYYVRNAGTLIGYIRSHPDCEIFCNLSADGLSADSTIFAGSPRFIEEHLLVRQNLIDDTAGVYFEHVLAAAVREAVGHGLCWAPFPEASYIEGVSASTNRSYNPSRFQRLYYNTLSKFDSQVWYPWLVLTKHIRLRMGLDRRKVFAISARFKKLLYCQKTPAQALRPERNRDEL
jgi:hypothetical protein